MHIESTIVIRRKADEVRRFLTDPSNLPKWDRSVAAVEWRNDSNPRGVGFEFTTVGHPGSGPDDGRMSYCVVAADPEGRDTRAKLTSRTGNARFIRKAEWRQIIEEAPEGSHVTMSTEFRLRLRYLWLGLVLGLIGKGALQRDLLNLKSVLENS